MKASAKFNYIYIFFSVIVMLLLLSSFIKIGVERYLMYICGFAMIFGLFVLFVALVRVALRKLKKV